MYAEVDKSVLYSSPLLCVGAGAVLHLSLLNVELERRSIFKKL